MKYIAVFLVALTALATPGQSLWSVEDHLAHQRLQFEYELEKNPRLMTKLTYLVDKEVGTQGTKAQQMFLETVMNRAVAREEKIADVLTPAYYPPLRKGVRPVGKAKEKKYAALLDNVLEGSNLSNFATDNASNDRRAKNMLMNKRKKQGRPGVVERGEFFYVDRPYHHFYTKMRNLLRGIV